MIRVAVTGSECTGKTTLAGALAGHYRTAVVPEFVRLWVDRHDRPPELDDVDAIARGHIELADECLQRANRLLILDTDLLSTWIYSHHYFGDCPTWIDRAVTERAADCYLLAGIDVPWTPDGDQRDRGHMREHMQGLFRDELDRRRLPWVDVVGSHEERMEQVVPVVDRLVGELP